MNPELHFFQDGVEAQDALEKAFARHAVAPDHVLATGAMASQETDWAVIELCRLGDRASMIAKIGESVVQVAELLLMEKPVQKVPMIVFYAEDGITPKPSDNKENTDMVDLVEGVLQTFNTNAVIGILNIAAHGTGSESPILLSKAEYIAGNYEPVRPPTV